MPSRRTTVALVVVAAAFGGYYAYGAVTGSPSAQTFESPENLTHPDGLGFHDESLERARTFAVDTERNVVERAATGEAESTVYICDDAFCIHVALPHENGTSRAFYHIAENGTARLPHAAAIRDAPPAEPVQRIFLVNTVDTGRSVDIDLVRQGDGTREDAGTVHAHVDGYDAALVTIDRLDPAATYYAEYVWQTEDGERHSFSLTFEPGNHSDEVWVFEE